MTSLRSFACTDRLQYSLLYLSMHFLCLASAHQQQTYLQNWPSPRLECTNDSIRLHFEPGGGVFLGHVYVRGYFPQSVCHLNYCARGIEEPFAFEIPYRGPCNVFRKQNATAIWYDVAVVVQHHAYFVTAADRAYRLSCVYRKKLETNVHHQIGVSDLPVAPLTQKQAPNCRYDVLSESLNGPAIRFAKVGDPIVHKWSCESSGYGLLVHSCVVRDDAGSDYPLIDERGCVKDTSLVAPVTYSKDLTTAFTTIRAFQFADQVTMHFACQITVCKTREQGCEGISPPTCNPIDLPPIKVIEYPNRRSKNQTSGSRLDEPVNLSTATTTTTTTTTTSTVRPIFYPPKSERIDLPYRPKPVTTTTRPVLLPKQEGDGYAFPNPAGSFPDADDSTASLATRNEPKGLASAPEYGLEISSIHTAPRTDHLSARSIDSEARTNSDSNANPPPRDPFEAPLTSPMQSFRTEKLAQMLDEDVTSEELPAPTAADVFRAGLQRRPSRREAGVAQNSTAAAITMDVESVEMVILPEDGDPIQNAPIVVCPKKSHDTVTTLFFTTCVAFQLITIVALFVQRYIYQKSLAKFKRRFDDVPR